MDGRSSMSRRRDVDDRAGHPSADRAGCGSHRKRLRARRTCGTPTIAR